MNRGASHARAACGPRSLGCVRSWPDGPGVVELPDGRTVRGRGLRRPAPPGPDPQFALHLVAREPAATPWERTWVRWPDFRAPSSTTDALVAIREAFDRCTRERVEVACGGGIGRTGTALAVMAVLAGVRPEEAVQWVRTNYHRRAVETVLQRRWIEAVGPSAGGAGA